MYHKDERKRDKFDYAITGIFICSIIVSFNHTIELYKSAGFDVPIKLLNTITEKWLGIGDFFTLALFATLAAEAAFTVGLWGLYEAFKVERKLPGGRYGWTWSMFFGGLIIIGWSNIGGTLGYNYLFGDPYKGYILGLSVPYFVLNAVLVNFSRSQPDEVIEQQTTEQPKWKRWINTYKEIKAEIATTAEPNKQIEQPNMLHQTPNTEQTELEQIEQPNPEQTNPAEHRTNTESTEHKTHSPEHIEQYNTQQEQTKHRTIEQEGKVKQQTAEHNGIEQKREPNTEQNEDAEQIEQDEVAEQTKSIERPNIEQEVVTEQPNKPKRRTKKSNTNLYVVRSNKAPSKTEQAVQHALKLLEQNKEFTVRDLADEVGCAVSTAQNALNKARERYAQQA